MESSQGGICLCVLGGGGGDEEAEAIFRGYTNNRWGIERNLAAPWGGSRDGYTNNSFWLVGTWFSATLLRLRTYGGLVFFFFPPLPDTLAFHENEIFYQPMRGLLIAGAMTLVSKESLTTGYESAFINTKLLNNFDCPSPL